MCNEYNGNANYQTWTVKSFILDNPTALEFWRSRYRELIQKYLTDPRVVQEGIEVGDLAAFRLEAELQAELEKANELQGMLHDLLNHAIKAVRYGEVVDAIIGE